jgi:3-oxoadipate enol-lactonase
MINEDNKGDDLVIEVDDFTVCYNDAGEGVIPLIFIHGFPFNKSLWHPQMEALKKSSRVISYDIRGFGKSTSGVKKATIDLFADDLIGFMDALHIDKAIVCGLSMGGYIVLNAALRFANRFTALILSDTQCIADTAEGILKRKESIKLIQDGGMEQFTDSFISKIFSPVTITEQRKVVEQVRVVMLQTAAVVIISTLNALAERSEVCSGLNKLTLPVLILCGKDDQITPLAQSELMHRQLVNSNLKVIENAGHMSNLEQPEVFNSILKNFIDELNSVKS